MKEKQRAKLKQYLIRDIFDLVKLNLIFVVCCLPVITIPAAITAMTRISIQLQRGDRIYVIADFLATLRKEFLDSLICGVVVVGVVLLLAYVFWFYQPMEIDGNLLLNVLRGLTLLPLLVCYCASCYLWVMNATVELPRTKRFRNALSLTVLCVKPTLVCLLTGVVFGGIELLSMPISTPFVFVAGFSFWNYICTFYTLPMVEQYVTIHEDIGEHIE